jgi:molybdate transport system substrate-binding protein
MSNSKKDVTPMSSLIRDVTHKETSAPLEVLSSIALKPLFARLALQLKQASGMRPAITFLASPAVQREIEKGAGFDVAISNPNIVDEMISGGHIATHTRVNIAYSTVGVVGRTGAPKRDVSTMDGFRRTLLSAQSIAHSDGGVGRLFMRMLSDMGIHGELQHKLKAVPAFSGAEVVARGEAEIAILITVAVLGVEGAELIGIPPAELWPYISFAGGVGTHARNPEPAAAFLACLAAAENNSVLNEIGMSRIPE